MSRESVDVVRRSLEAFNARDVDDLVSLSDPDAEWLHSGRSSRASAARVYQARCAKRARRRHL
jgi:ketosteroid isomerase-like protein